MNISFLELRNTLQKGISAMQSNKVVQAISGGMMLLLPVMIVGSFASVLGSINIDTYQEIISSTGIKSVFKYCSSATMNIISVYVVCALAWKMADLHKKDGILAATLAIMAFFLVTPVTSFEKIKAIELTFLGARGMIVAMITGLSAARMYVWLLDLKLTIKMPEQVPDFVSRSFSSLIPAFIIGLVFSTINELCSLTRLR